MLLRWTSPHPGRLASGVADPRRWIEQDGLDAVVAQVAGAVGWLLLAWAAAGVVLLSAARLPGMLGRLAGSAARRALPAGVRRVAAVALGVTLAGTATEAAAGTPPGVARIQPSADPSLSAAAAGHQSTADGGETYLLVDWPLVDRPTEPAPVGRRAPVTVDWPLSGIDGPAGRVPGGGQRGPAVVVAAGDTLWSIAARRIGSGGTVADVAAEWPRWYAANRTAVGPDPAHLRVGLRLLPPPAP